MSSEHPSELARQLNHQQQRLTPGFRPGLLQRDHTVFQFEFDDGAAFALEVNETAFAFTEGVHPRPTINLYLDNHTTCWQLLDGSLDGMQAFMAGRYRADGNIVLSQLMLHLFSAADLMISYEVRD